MKQTKLLLTSLLIAATALFSTSCNSQETKVKAEEENLKQAKTNLTAAENEFAVEVAKFKAETNDKIKANENSIHAIKEKMKGEGGEVKADFKQQVETLENRNNDLRKRLDAYKPVKMNDWQSFKSEFSHDLSDLGTSIKDFFVDSKK
ncbi:MAG: hypothetical protein JNL47_12270 [Bacteroidia bacterium]|nr:hypothetical protein [Bacteroidia bacterium]